MLVRFLMYVAGIADGGPGDMNVLNVYSSEEIIIQLFYIKIITVYLDIYHIPCIQM